MRSEKQQLLILIGVFAALMLCESVFAYFCVSESSQIQQALDKLASEEQDAQKKIKRIPGLTKESRELAQVIGEYAQILPREEEVRFDAFLEDIDRFTRDSEIELRLAEPVKIKQTAKKKSEKAKGRNTFIRHTYRFELEGTYLQLLKFINKIENHPRFLRVDEVHIDSLSETGSKQSEAERAENPEKAIQLVISTYTYSKENEEAK